MSFFSCKKEDKINELKDGFVTEVGKYRIQENEFELFRVVDGSLTFAMQDPNENLLFQLGLSSNFNSYQMWVLYFDDNHNLWFYNSDYAGTYVWIQDQDGKYICHNYCEEDITLPTQFIDFLGKRTNGLCPKFD